MNRLIDAAGPVQRAGRAIALIGAVLPLLKIGGMKFTQVEIDGLEPLISDTALNILGRFLLKDVALLGIALVITGEALARMRSLRVRPAQGDRP
jgi:uncharacterized membrane protein YkgB